MPIPGAPSDPLKPVVPGSPWWRETLCIQYLLNLPIWLETYLISRTLDLSHVRWPHTSPDIRKRSYLLSWTSILPRKARYTSQSWCTRFTLKKSYQHLVPSCKVFIMVKNLASILNVPYMFEPPPPRVKEHKPLVQIRPGLSLPGCPSLLVNLVLPREQNGKIIKFDVSFYSLSLS